MEEHLGLAWQLISLLEPFIYSAFGALQQGVLAMGPCSWVSMVGYVLWHLFQQAGWYTASQWAMLSTWAGSYPR